MKYDLINLRMVSNWRDQGIFPLILDYKIFSLNTSDTIIYKY